MDGPEDEILGKAGREHAHRLRILPYDGQGIVVYVVLEQGVSYVGAQFPAGNVQLALDAGGGDFGEVVLPLEVVGIEVLLVEFRFLQAGLEMGA